MGRLTIRIGTEGPVIDVLIGGNASRQAALRKARQPLPRHVAARLLIDTGASRTIMDLAIVAQMPAMPTDMVLVDSHSGRQRATEHDVGLYLPDARGPMVWIPSLPVLALQSAAAYKIRGLAGVLGRDVLDQCQFTYNGPEQTFTLSDRAAFVHVDQGRAPLSGNVPGGPSCGADPDRAIGGRATICIGFTMERTAVRQQASPAAR